MKHFGKLNSLCLHSTGKGFITLRAHIPNLVQIHAVYVTALYRQFPGLSFSLQGGWFSTEAIYFCALTALGHRSNWETHTGLSDLVLFRHYTYLSISLSAIRCLSVRSQTQIFLMPLYVPFSYQTTTRRHTTYIDHCTLFWCDHILLSNRSAI